jgi:type VI secretion system protein VasD
MLARTHAPLLRRLPALLAAGFAAGALGVVSALACSSATPPPEPPKPCDVQIVTLNILASDNINPNDTGNPRPVVVRLYQLKSDVRLLNAQYDDVLLKDKDVLADDVMKVDEVGVFPNDMVEVKFERVKDASFLAGVALFHSPKGQSWKTFYEFPLPPGEASCGGRAGDAAPEADPRATFFIESTKIDNGSQFDETMFPDAAPVRKITLPKGSSSPSAGQGAGEGAPGSAPPPAQ